MLIAATLVTALVALPPCFIAVVLPGLRSGYDPPPAQASVTILDGTGGYVLAGIMGYTFGTPTVITLKNQSTKQEELIR